MRRMLAIAWKESIEIMRDSRTLTLAIILPVIMILLFGYAINMDVDHIPVGIADLDHSRESREFQQKLFSPGWLQKKTEHTNLEFLEKEMQRGNIKMIIVLPPGFAVSLKRADTAQVFAGIDGSDNMSGSMSMAYFQTFLALYEMRRMELLYGIDRDRAPGFESLPRIFFNPELESRYFVLPGIIVLTLAVLSALLTSISIAREWERGSMEQLIATPVRPWEILYGKLLPYIGISMIQLTLTIILGVFLFGVPLRGSLLNLFLVSLLFSVGALGLGLLFSSVIKVQIIAMQVSMIATLLPSVFLSGFIFPIESMTPIIQAFTYIVPAKYYLVMVRTIFLKGSGFAAFWAEAVFLFVFSMIVLNAATHKIVKRVA